VQRRFDHRRCVLAAVLLLVGGALGGCQLATARIEPAPLSAAEQQLAILELAPVGTPRDEAVERLVGAGIEGGFGATGARSTYYCDLWRRPDGNHWHLDVALLFDDHGRVWIARSGSLSAEPTATVADGTPPR
jgi:hypothetical protein